MFKLTSHVDLVMSSNIIILYYNNHYINCYMLYNNENDTTIHIRRDLEFFKIFTYQLSCILSTIL